jgi:hypothetical protein
MIGAKDMTALKRRVRDAVLALAPEIAEAYDDVTPDEVRADLDALLDDAPQEHWEDLLDVLERGVKNKLREAADVLEARAHRSMQ